jgi:hypothetical protein
VGGKSVKIGVDVGGGGSVGGERCAQGSGGETRGKETIGESQT